MGASKKRRQTKHRGNAAGMVEARGRAAGGRNAVGADKPTGPQPPKPPSWQRAYTKALIPVVILAPILYFTNPDAKPMAIIPLIAIAYLAYVPLSYYSDRFVYNRFIKRSG